MTKDRQNVESDIFHTQRVQVKQQADGTWKAWAPGVNMVVFAKTESKAIQVVDRILGDREEDQEKDQ